MRIISIDTKRLWEDSKAKLPLHQVIATETLIDLAGSYAICWICGDRENIFHIATENEDGEEVCGIMCGDCLKIQKNMGTNIIRKTLIT